MLCTTSEGEKQKRAFKYNSIIKRISKRNFKMRSRKLNLVLQDREKNKDTIVSTICTLEARIRVNLSVLPSSLFTTKRNLKSSCSPNATPTFPKLSHFTTPEKPQARSVVRIDDTWHRLDVHCWRVYNACHRRRARACVCVARVW